MFHISEPHVLLFRRPLPTSNSMPMNIQGMATTVQ